MRKETLNKLQENFLSINIKTKEIRKINLNSIKKKFTYEKKIEIENENNIKFFLKLTKLNIFCKNPILHY